ncbi:MAG: hypothetical protein AAGK78_11000, partial [Planctomycetota bacterium]
MPDLAKYLPQPRRVPPPPPNPPEDDGRRAEVVELAARRAQLGQDLVTPEAPVTVAPADRSDRAEELDQALNDVLGIQGEDKTTRASLQTGASLTSSPSLQPGASFQAGGAVVDAGLTQDVDEDMLASDDLFANIPRAASVDEVNRESTRFFVAAAGVNKQRKRRRIGMISGIAVVLALFCFLGGWAFGLISIKLPGIGDPFANMRQTWSPEPDDADGQEGLSSKEVAL